MGDRLVTGIVPLVLHQQAFNLACPTVSLTRNPAKRTSLTKQETHQRYTAAHQTLRKFEQNSTSLRPLRDADSFISGSASNMGSLRGSFARSIESDLPDFERKLLGTGIYRMLLRRSVRKALRRAQGDYQRNKKENGAVLAMLGHSDNRATSSVQG